MDLIKNYMEVCVEEMLDMVIKNLDGCNCEKCRIDTMAIALNSLPPKYVVTEKGDFYTRLSVFQQQFEVDVVAAITKAVVMVKQNPRHEKDEYSRIRKEETV